MNYTRHRSHPYTSGTPSIFTETACNRGDGVQLDLSGIAGTTLSYPYNPFADATLRPARRFDIGPVSTGPDGLLRLDITAGPANNGDCDWAYVRDVTIRAADGT